MVLQPLSPLIGSKLWDNLCNQFGIIRNPTTSYHPQSNGMVERFHRQLKAAIMVHESPNPWTITLPAVLLGVCSAVKERLGRSAAEMIYGTTLRLPGEFTKQYTVDANTDLENYSDKLRLAMSRLRLCPPRDTQQHNIFQYKEIVEIGVAESLTGTAVVCERIPAYLYIYGVKPRVLLTP